MILKKQQNIYIYICTEALTIIQLGHDYLRKDFLFDSTCSFLEIKEKEIRKKGGGG